MKIEHIASLSRHLQDGKIRKSCVSVIGCCVRLTRPIRNWPTRFVSKPTTLNATPRECVIRSSVASICSSAPASLRPVQDCHWLPPETVRHVPDRARRQRHHRPPLPSAQPQVRGLPGFPLTSRLIPQ